MKRNVVIAAAVLSGAVLLRMSALAEEEQKYIFTAEKLEKAAVVDGVAGKDEYPSGVMTMAQTPDRDKIEGAPAQARVFHDGKVLYVIITVPVKSADAVNRGESWSQDDAGEVCFRDASTSKPGSTFVIHGFSSGKHECVDLGGASAEETAKLGKDVKFSAKVDKNSWTGEWAIPLKSAGIEYKPELKLDFNLGVWRSESNEWIIWRGANGATYQVEEAGKLILK